MSLGRQCTLGQHGLSDLLESFISCPPAVMFIAEMTVIEQRHISRYKNAHTACSSAQTQTPGQM